MGGYYTNNYGYYNPYLEEERKRQEEIRRKEESRQQLDVLKMLSKSVNKCSGVTVNDARLEELYAPMFEETMPEELKMQMILLDNHYNGQDYNPYVNNVFEAQYRVYEHRQSLVPKDCDLQQFMDKSINLVDDILKKEETTRNAENLARLYNKQGYKDIVGTYSGDSSDYFKNMYDNNDPLNVTIDDIEHQFPPYKESVDAQERSRFMQKVINQIKSRNNEGYM